MACWLAGLAVVSIHADRATIDPTRTQSAFPLAAPPVIDGVVTQAEWELAGGYVYDYWSVQPDANALDGIRAGVMGFGLLPEDSEDLSFRVSAGYDDTYLYIAVRVKDDQPNTDSAEPDSKDQTTWEDDSVEVFVDGKNANDAKWSAANPGGQFSITANNAYRELEAGSPGYGETAAWYAKTAPTLEGYEAEFRIAWSILGGRPESGQTIGFTVAVNDAEFDVRETQVLWEGKPHEPVTYGNLQIGPRSYTAPLVAQAPVVDGTIEPSEYPGAEKVHLGGAVGLWDFGGSSEDSFTEATLNYDWWIVHTADAVYVAVNVTDDQIVNDNPDAQAGMEDGNTWEDDSIEVFFDSDHTRNAGGNNVNYEGQYAFTASGARRDTEAGNPPDFGLPGGWKAATKLTAKGYQTEFLIPKANLQNPTNGTVMGFMTAVNDEDAPPFAAGNQLLWFGASHREYTYGLLKLDGPPTVIEPVRIVEAKPALATGDLSVRWEKGRGPLFQLQRAAAVTGPFEPLHLAQAGRAFTDQGVLKALQPGFYRVMEGADGFPPLPVRDCVTTPGSGTWVNTSFANQTGVFTATFDATPSVARIDAVMGLSSGPKTAFADVACLVRFNNADRIDARNGGGYEAANDIPYTAGVSYTFRLAVNVPARTYSIYVTPAGGAEQTVGVDFAFRSSAGEVANLDNWSLVVAGPVGSAAACHFLVAPECVTTPGSGTWVNNSFANQTGSFTATFEATVSVAQIDAVIGLSPGPKTAFADFACLVRFNNAGAIDARNGGGYEAANDIPYEPGVSYTFRLAVNVPARTYSIYVTPAGGAEQAVGVDFAFRSSAGAVANLDSWGVVLAGPAGEAVVCKLKAAP